MGACWNAGVFAFRLGYMTDIAEKYVQGERYADISKAFGAFPKISFDYEVVEREKSLVMVPFYGEWKDLGTWSTLENSRRAQWQGTSPCAPFPQRC